MVKTKNVGFESGGSASPAPKQPNQRRAVVRLLATFTHGFRRLFALGLLMLILESVTAVFEPYPLAYLIDFLNGKGRTFLSFPGLASHRASTVAVLTLAIVVLAAANSACDSLAELYLARGGRTLGYNIRIALYSHLQKLSLAFHNQRRTGDVLTRVTGDVQAVEEFIVNSLSDLAGSVFLLVGTLGFLFYRSWRVALMALVLVPLLSLVSRYFSKRIKATAKRQRAREGDLASEASEMLSAIRVIQTYGGGGREQQKFADASKKAFGAAVETAGLEAKFSFVVSVMEALITSAVVWLGLLLITHGQLSVGTLVLFVILIQNMFKPTRRIIKEFANIGKTYASVDRIGELLDRQPPVTDLPDAIAAPKLRGEIELRDVSFAYLQDPEDAAPAG
jgi:ATP-binding cassette, subfamily B, bacterial